MTNFSRLSILILLLILVSLRAHSMTMMEWMGLNDSAYSLTGAEKISGGHWPNGFAMVEYIDAKGRCEDATFDQASYVHEWGEVNRIIANRAGVTSAVVSPEYASYRMGAVYLLGPAVYTSSFASLRNQHDCHGNVWMTLIQPRTRAEFNCLTLSESGGCGDVWQDGIANAELACHDGQTYLRCHLNCIQKLRGVKMASTPGACETAYSPATPAPKKPKTTSKKTPKKSSKK